MHLFNDRNTKLIANSEIYTTMRANATFLLELSPHINTVIPESSTIEGKTILSSSNGNGTRRSPQQMPVVIEYQNLDFYKSNSNQYDYNNHASSSNVGKLNGKCSTIFYFFVLNFNYFL